jgi:hypothetical protein
MGNEPNVPAEELEEDAIDQETATPLPSREVMSIIDPSPGPKIPYQPPDPEFTPGQGIDEGDPG